MYDMYPDWGPAKNDPENPRSTESLQSALDQRDTRAPRPDDN